MHYSIKNGKSLSHLGKARVIAVVPTITDEGPDGVGFTLDVACLDGPHVKLVVQPADFDDEASCSQLARLAERLQLMVTAARNRRAGGGLP